MIQRQLKLRLKPSQEQQLTIWLSQLTGVWNWAIRKLELDAKDGIYYTQKAFHNLLADHSKKLGILSHTLQGMLDTAYMAWQRFHAQALPDGCLKSGRLVKRASGWYLCLFIDAAPQPIPSLGDGIVGIDPGFTTLLTLSTGEKISHPRELDQTCQRLAQAQRGNRKRLTARLHERLAYQRTDRNHKLSRRLVAENQTIVWSRDHQTAIAKSFGKSVASAGHAQLRSMLAYKCTASGRQYLEVNSRSSTKTCSACGCLTGPTGYVGLRVRHWVCTACGAGHDRDVNAAINTLHAGVGTTLERHRKVAPGIPEL